MKMQKLIIEQTRAYIREVSEQFELLQSGHFIFLSTGEMFTQAEYDKYIKGSIEQYKVEMFKSINEETESIGIENEQRIINNRSQKKTKKLNTRHHYDRGGNFLITYKDSLEELIDMKLNTNEKLVYYVLRDFVQYPTNCLVIKDHIPTIQELEPLVGLSNRSIVDALQTLDDKGLIKRKQYGHRKAIYFNPYYYASGKDLEIEVLQMFELLECDDMKVAEHLKENKIIVKNLTNKSTEDVIEMPNKKSLKQKYKLGELDYLFQHEDMVQNNVTSTNI
jgi:hypothetical protein